MAGTGTWAGGIVIAVNCFFRGGGGDGFLGVSSEE
jgi:hypothetical protein